VTRTTARLAWRDLRNSGARSLFIVLALAISMASVGGVHGAAEVARKALQADSRAWLAGDLAIDTRETIDQLQALALDGLKPRGIDWTVVTTSLTMASSDESADPGLIQVKVIDPASYPFYGAVTLRPSVGLADAVRDGGVAVSEEVLQRFDVHRGDNISVGGHPFRISAIVQGEPDRFSNEVGIGLRCIISANSWKRAGLDRSPNPVKNRILLRLAPGANASNASNAREFLQELFPEGNLRDSQGAHRRETELTETVIGFLSVTAFLALSLGSLGAAIALRQHAEHSMPTFAIMKMLGAQSPRLAAIYCLQVMWILAAAIAIGVPLGFVLRVSILSLAGKYLVLPPVATWTSSVLFESAAATLIALAPVLIQPALWIRTVRPAIVLRRSMSRAMSGSTPLRGANWITAFTALLSCCAFVWVAQWMLGDWRSAVIVTMTIAATIGLAIVFASVAVYLLRNAMPAALKRRSPLLRCGIANLYGPGNRSRTLIGTLAVSLVMMIATFEGRTAAVKTVLEILPNDQASLYVAGFKRLSSAGDVAVFLRSLRGVFAVDLTVQARIQIRGVDRPLDRRLQTRIRRSTFVSSEMRMHSKPVLADGACDSGYALHNWDGIENTCLEIRQVAASAGVAEDIRSALLKQSDNATVLTADEWNYYYEELGGPPPPGDLFPTTKRTQIMTVDYYLQQRANVEFSRGQSHAAVCGGRDVQLTPLLAQQLRAKIGSQLIVDTRDQTIEMRVGSIGDLSAAEAVWASIKMDCGALGESSLVHQAAVRIQDDQIPEVTRAIRAKYPALAVISSKEIAQTVTALTKDAMRLAQLVAWYAIAGGLFVLMAIVAASRGARLSEVAILSALGARRITVVKIYSIEFATIGLIAALIASVLAWGLTSAVLNVVFHRTHLEGAAIDWKTTMGVTAISAAIVLIGGWLPTLRLLFRKPLEALRAE
jgi:predicted lysophospholipase L1 biosynthesis ABC-type transport system permease subunit